MLRTAKTAQVIPACQVARLIKGQLPFKEMPKSTLAFRMFGAVPVVHAAATHSRGWIAQVLSAKSTKTLASMFQLIPCHWKAVAIKLTPQTGDMGFYGSHGASYHITLALDSSTMIFEPQPGENCKKEPISWYPPSWWERNDQMASIVAGSDSGNDSGATTTGSKEMYYFAPFWYRNQESYNRWGSFAGGDITSDTIQNRDEMMRYADTQFKLNPDLEIDITLDGNAAPIAGEVIRVEVKPKHFVTTVPMVGYTWHPYSKGAATTETFNSNGKNILDFDNSQTRTVNDIRQQVKTYIANSSTTSSGQETWTESEAEQYANSERN